jgi:BASS family bile acid:Na+ symporter
MSAGRLFLRSLAFPAAVVAAVALSLAYPAAFGVWFGLDLKVLIVPLVQVITFGMGTTLCPKDFRRVLLMPWPVVVGFILQFSIMPLVGFAIANLLGFEPEIAAGVILIGSVSGGVASNLINYLAGNNVALSVTMTALTTLGAPIMTPFWMKTLAGRLVPVDFLEMMFSIIDMIIVPIVAGLAANRILYGGKPWTRSAGRLALIGGFCAAAAAALVPVGMSFLGPLATLKRGLILGLLLIALVALAKLVIGNLLRGPENWMDKALPLVSMAGICLIIAIITARASAQLLQTGLLLIVAAMIHNAAGYTFGYAGARAFGLNKVDARTVSVEVGMQNGGMASGIAMDVLKSAGAALAPAVFGPWMNVSGSLVAAYWRRKTSRL